MIPRATYRVQFHKDFTFADGARLGPYLAKLGISHLYASPILHARAGSTHGYDVVDHRRINPELGGEDAFRMMAAASARARDRHRPRHRAQSHGGGRRGQSLVARRAGEGCGKPVRAIFRHRLESTRRCAAQQGAGAVSGRALSARFWNRATCPDLGRHAGPAVPSPIMSIAFRFARATMPKSAARRRAAGRRPVAHGRRPRRCTAFWNDSISGWPGGARPPTRSTGAASSRSTIWRRCGSRIRAYSRRCTPKSSTSIAEGLIDWRAHRPCRRPDPSRPLLPPSAQPLRARRRTAAPEARQDNPISSSKRSWRMAKRLPADWQVQGTTGYEFMNDVSALQHDAAGGAPLAKLWSQTSLRPAEFDPEERLARRQVSARRIRRSAGCRRTGLPGPDARRAWPPMT